MKKKISNYLQIKAVPFLVSLLIRFLYKTNKRVFHLPANMPKEPFILALWHGELLMMPLGYKKLKANGNLLGVISEHRDGETIKRVFERFDIGAVRGSSTRGGAKALIAAIGALKNGIDVGITPDGPRGPRHQVASGIVAMAQKTNSKIITYSFQPSRYWQLKSWDKFIVPKPFGTIHFYLSEPFDVNGLDPEAAKIKIKSELMKNITPDLY